MIYMDKYNYELLPLSAVYDNINIDDYDTFDEAIAGKYIPLDDLIAPVVAELNSNGYETVYSCAGHPKQYSSLYIAVKGNHVDTFRKAFIKKRCHSLFTIEYKYDYYGNLNNKELTDITTIRLSLGAAVQEYPLGDYYNCCKRHIQICRMLYDAVKDLPDNNNTTNRESEDSDE